MSLFDLPPEGRRVGGAEEEGKEERCADECEGEGMGVMPRKAEREDNGRAEEGERGSQLTRASSHLVHGRGAEQRRRQRDVPKGRS